jgi:hypothetical protein
VIVEDSQADTKVTDLGMLLKEHPGMSVVRVPTVEEFASSTLCNNRPQPRYHDELRIGKEVADGTCLLVRKDRFIFVSCKSLVEIWRVCHPYLASEDLNAHYRSSNPNSILYPTTQSKALSLRWNEPKRVDADRR